MPAAERAMTFGESFESALTNLAVHKLRSALTMLGMIFGVGAVIAMLSIGAGAEKQALEMIERLGLRNVHPAVEGDEGRGARGGPEEIARPVVARRAGDPGRGPGCRSRRRPRSQIEPYKVLSATAKTKAKVYGVSFRQAEISRLRVCPRGGSSTRWTSASHAQVCVIGPGVRRDLFGYGPAVGSDLKVNDVWLTVVGVLADEGGASAFEGRARSARRRGRSTCRSRRRAGSSTARRSRRRSTSSSCASTPTAEPRTTVGRSCGSWSIASTASADDFDLVVPEALLEQSRKTQRLFSIVMGCIAGISLLVGGIGIMNIMLATVLERTREIGVRRAVGARRLDIRNQFIIESFSISALGGVLGIAVGLLIAKAVAAYAGWPTVVTIASIVLSTGVSIAVGLASGIYPAVRAAELDPIDALRYE